MQIYQNHEKNQLMAVSRPEKFCNFVNMDVKTIEQRLTAKGVRPTSNRITVFRALAVSSSPLSLSELETELLTIDKSSIFRVLSLFAEHDLVHDIDDGSGSVKYEICQGVNRCSPSDMHIHFHCQRCHRTFCLEEISIPVVELPEGFSTHSINYMIKGICPECGENCR